MIFKKTNLLWVLIFFVVILLEAGCGTVRPPQQEEPATAPSKPLPVIDPAAIPVTPREMRAAWIATVDNIDWPSAPGLPVAQQKAELRALLDRAAKLNLNAVIFQVRPAADAFYKSSLEPWSEFLTGEQGKAPQPFYDPLAFAIEQAHRRGLELHAWFNPFRAWHYAAEGNVADNHIRNTKPRLIKKYGRYWWMNPGNPSARKHSMQVILDVARRYQIDGVHLDDYFYPYAEKNARGNIIPFPDEASYQRYVSQNGPIEKNDWRRQNINQFVQKLHKELKQVEPRIRFGISPFGIWRPGHPPQIEGYDAYDNLYADARKWFREGWVDYLSPQLYWAVDNPGQRFPVLLKWWHQQNQYDRHLWPGLYTSRVPEEWNAGEIIRQIRLIRKQPGASGHIHFSMQALMSNTNDIAAQLIKGAYAQPALVPASRWITHEKPSQPEASLIPQGHQFLLQLNPGSEDNPWLWVLKTKYTDTWEINIIPGWKQSLLLPMQNKNGQFSGVVISKVGRLGHTSTPQMLLPVVEQVEKTK